MKKIFTFNQRMMNGTVTMQSQVAAFTSRELAEKTKFAVAMANIDHDGPFTCHCDDIVETDVYETEGEVPILKEISLPAGFGDLYVSYGNVVRKDVDGVMRDVIEIVFPDDEREDEMACLRKIVCLFAKEILENSDDEARKQLECKLQHRWMQDYEYSTGYRDHHTWAEIERHTDGTAKVSFKYKGIY